jgi:hypothetical protein
MSVQKRLPDQNQNQLRNLSHGIMKLEICAKLVNNIIGNGKIVERQRVKTIYYGYDVFTVYIHNGTFPLKYALRDTNLRVKRWKKANIHKRYVRNFTLHCH